jgi:hypothetical protein
MLTAPTARLVLLLATLMLAACASPPWAGMEEAEVTAWKQADFSAEMAATWSDGGFAADEASAWRAIGADASSAAAWKAESFTPDEAKMWRTAEINLKEAITNRSKGLMPVPVKVDVEETAAEAADEAKSAAEGMANEVEGAMGEA